MSYTLAYQGAEIDDILGRAAPSGALDTAIAAKQDVLTFDDTPESGSDNPVKSGGIYDAIQAGGAAALAAFATDTVSGDIVSFPDGADGIPVKAFTGSIVPAQSGSGDPAPDNIRPISGWTGANIYRIKMEQGSYSAESGNIDVSTRIRSNGWIKQTGGAITVTLSPSNYEWIVFNADSADGANAASIGGWSNSGATGTVLKQYIKIIVRNKTNPSADITPAEVVAKIDGIDPTIAIAFGSTVYAGTLTALGGGLWKVQPTHALATITGSETVNAFEPSTDAGGGYLLWYLWNDVHMNNIKRANNTNYAKKSNQFAWKDRVVGDYKAIPIGQFSGNRLGPNNMDNWVAFCLPSEYDTQAKAVAYVTANPIQVWYELADASKPAPITITGDDLQTLLGANTVWQSCGSVTELTYRADTALYIQKLLNGGGTLQTLSMASPSPSLSLGRVGVLAEPEVSEPEQTEEVGEQPEESEEE